jgi:AhpD family alkylhydroperoxidase
VSDTPSVFTDQIKELVALGAAMAANCEPCFKHHYDLAHKLGVSKEDMLEAVNTALAVKATPHRKVVETAQKFLAPAPALPESTPSACGCGGSSCC